MLKNIVTLFYLSLIVVPAISQSVQLSKAPEYYQLFARDQNDSSTVLLAGKVDQKKFQGKVMLKVYKDGAAYDSKQANVNHSSFNLSTKISAGLSQYSFRLFLKNGGKEKLCYAADSVVCGDAYIITGQSNSHASSSKSIYSSPYCRSFGVKTGYEPYNDEDKQVHWGRATGNCPGLKGIGGWFTKNKYGVGAWGMELMKEMVEKYKMPVCIINGGSGSSSIEENMLAPELPSLETSFGRLAYRVNQAGLKDGVKAIFWHQGESDTDERYKAYARNFDVLLSDWKSVYTGLKRVYLFQLHPGCGGNYQSELRETQYRISQKYSMVKIMSTTGVPGHDGCHYSYEGYKEMARRILPLVATDFYNEKSDGEILPPTLINAYAASKNEIVLSFDQPVEFEAMHKEKGKKHYLKDQFFFREHLTDEPQSGIIEKINSDQNRLFLQVNSHHPFKYITWLPNVNYQNTSTCYEGPWITGTQNKLGALSFDRRPILSSANADKQGESIWNGFKMLDSTINEVPFKLVFPAHANDNRNWIWRARFWGHEPQTDIALLNKGFHVAYIEVGGLFGNEKAIQIWNTFYDYMTKKYNLNQKVVLEGMSRGGLIIFNWGNRNADKVACIYGDAPVCDFKSWPGGKGKGIGSSSDWDACLKQYGFSEQIAINYHGNPINHMEYLAKEKVPILIVVGDADKVVPVAENAALLQSRYEKLGMKMQMIHKPGIGHHPHSLKDPTPIVDFIINSVGQ